MVNVQVYKKIKINQKQQNEWHMTSVEKITELLNLPTLEGHHCEVNK